MKIVHFCFFIFCVMALFVSCLNDDEPKDWTEVVNLYVSSETADYKPLESNPDAEPGIGIQIRTSTSDAWSTVDVNAIEGFSYEEGFEYHLKVEKTHLANPPADALGVKYKLIEIIFRK